MTALQNHQPVLKTAECYAVNNAIGMERSVPTERSLCERRVVARIGMGMTDNQIKSALDVEPLG